LAEGKKAEKVFGGDQGREEEEGIRKGKLSGGHRAGGGQYLR
jgi:hypothetical protein